MLMTILNIELVTVCCWFARDVTAAMMHDQNKSISLLWDLKLYFHVNSSRKTSHPTWPPGHVVANQEF